MKRLILILWTAILLLIAAQSSWAEGDGNGKGNDGTVDERRRCYTDPPKWWQWARMWNCPSQQQQQQQSSRSFREIREERRRKRLEAPCVKFAHQNHFNEYRAESLCRDSKGHFEPVECMLYAQNVWDRATYEEKYWELERFCRANESPFESIDCVFDELRAGESWPEAIEVCR